MLFFGGGEANKEILVNIWKREKYDDKSKVKKKKKVFGGHQIESQLCQSHYQLMLKG